MCTYCREGGEKRILVDCLELHHSYYEIGKFNTSHKHIAVSSIPYKIFSHYFPVLLAFKMDTLFFLK